MPKYKVYVQETNIYIYDVEADTPEEAWGGDSDIEDSYILSCEEKLLAVEEASKHPNSTMNHEA
jgi:hypothetical protein